MNYLLDTDHMTFLERAGTAGLNLRTRLLAVPATEYGTTIVTYEEQMRGWMARMAQANTPERRVTAYSLLSVHVKMFREFAVLPFDTQASAEFERLRRLRLHVGTQDLKIGAIALANNVTVLTRNVSDFTKIPGLRVEDWSV